MEDIEVVIKIDTETYKNIIENGFIYDEDNEYVTHSIKNSTQLHKGHGRIGDLDALIQTMKERNDDNGGEPLNTVDRGYNLAYQHMVKEAKECVIIEADKEKNNE